MMISDITREEVCALPALHVGQQVTAFSNRWTPDGWEPVEDHATVLDPCVQDDPDYAGEVEIKIDGVVNRVFVPRASVEPFALPAEKGYGA